MTEFFQQMLNGIHVGSIYALIALGYTMVYGIVRLINFAHGEILMMGAYFGLLSLTLLNLPFGLVIVVAMVSCAIVGMLIDKVAYKPLRNAPRISALITALGMSMLIQNLYIYFVGAKKRVVPSVQLFGVDLSQNVEVFGIRITYTTVVTILLTVLTMGVLQYVVKKTRVGKAMRAVSEDKHASTLMGINVDRVISITFAIGSALGALGGVLYSVAYPQVNPMMGVLPGLKAFVAAVLGGIGVIPGAMIGGYLIGIIESLTKGYLKASMSDGIVFGILIIVLLFKPAGLLGKNIKEKV